jgi:hypothetical protein
LPSFLPLGVVYLHSLLSLEFMSKPHAPIPAFPFKGEGWDGGSLDASGHTPA